MDAADKYANIMAMIQKENLCNTCIVIIGDTLSDYFLAEQSGVILHYYPKGINLNNDCVEVMTLG